LEERKKRRKKKKKKKEKEEKPIFIKISWIFDLNLRKDKLSF